MTAALFNLDAAGRWRLSYDQNQWILQLRKRAARPGDGASVLKSAWRGVSFIGSEKRVLRRCIRERGIILASEAHARLDVLPERFSDFLVNRGDLSPPAVPSRAA